MTFSVDPVLSIVRQVGSATTTFPLRSYLSDHDQLPHLLTELDGHSTRTPHVIAVDKKKFSETWLSEGRNLRTSELKIVPGFLLLNVY